MAIRDERTTFAKSVSLNTGGAADYVIGDVVDLSTSGRDLGAGNEGLFFVVQVSTAVTGTGPVSFSLGTSDSASLAGAEKVATSPAIPVASLTAGYRAFAVQLPTYAYKRYIGLIQTSVGAVTAGSVTSFLAEDINAIRYYAQGFTG